MKKELRRSRVDQRILGVCSGIAEYMQVDVNTVRAIAVIAALLIHNVVLAYIILGIVLPADE